MDILALLAFLLDSVRWLKYCHWQQHDIQSTTYLQWSACSFCPLTSTALVLWEKCPASTQMSRREDVLMYSTQQETFMLHYNETNYPQIKKQTTSATLTEIKLYVYFAMDVIFGCWHDWLGLKWHLLTILYLEKKRSSFWYSETVHRSFTQSGSWLAHTAMWGRIGIFQSKPYGFLSHFCKNVFPSELIWWYIHYG